MSTPLVHPFPILHGGEFVRHGGSGLAADDRLVHGDAWPLHGGDPPRHRRLLRHGGVLVLHPDTAPPEPSWTDLGEHPSAAAVSTAAGRFIVTLLPYQGRIVAGYGTWDPTNDPMSCDILAWDPVEVEWQEIHADYVTNATWGIRDLGGTLWVLPTDPSGGTNPDYLTFDGTTVTVANNTGHIVPFHMFDVCAWEGSTYLAGSMRNDPGGISSAAVWKYPTVVSGSTRWKDVLNNIGAFRCHGLLPFDGALYACCLYGAAFKTTDGETWSSFGTNLGTEECHKPVPIAGQVVYGGDWPAHGTHELYAFDETTVTELRADVIDHYLDGARLLVLTSGYEVLATEDLDEWEVLAEDAPDDARSVCVLDGAIYVGTEDSHLWMFA